MIKEEILEKVRQDNDMTLDLAKELKMPQATVFARIDRKSKTFKVDVRVVNFLKEKGFSDEEIFETEKMPYKSLSNN